MLITWSWHCSLSMLLLFYWVFSCIQLAFADGKISTLDLASLVNLYTKKLSYLKHNWFLPQNSALYNTLYVWRTQPVFLHWPFICLSVPLPMLQISRYCASIKSFIDDMNKCYSSVQTSFYVFYVFVLFCIFEIKI